MIAVEVPTPPTIVEHDGALFVETIFDAPDGEKYVVRAPIGSGQQFAVRVLELILFPALLTNDVTRKAQMLLDALQAENANHGDLRTPESRRAENLLRTAINRKDRK